jgi:hypothetical protein
MPDDTKNKDLNADGDQQPPSSPPMAVIDVNDLRDAAREAAGGTDRAERDDQPREPGRALLPRRRRQDESQRLRRGEGLARGQTPHGGAGLRLDPDGCSEHVLRDDVRRLPGSQIDQVAGALGWDAGSVPVLEAVNDALLDLAVSNIASVTDIRGLRALGRRAIWRAVVQATAGNYAFTDVAQQTFNRQQVNAQAQAMLKIAEATVRRSVSQPAPVCRRSRSSASAARMIRTSSCRTASVCRDQHGRAREHAGDRGADVHKYRHALPQVINAGWSGRPDGLLYRGCRVSLLDRQVSGAAV